MTNTPHQVRCQHCGFVLWVCHGLACNFKPEWHDHETCSAECYRELNRQNPYSEDFDDYYWHNLYGRHTHEEQMKAWYESIEWLLRQER